MHTEKEAAIRTLHKCEAEVDSQNVFLACPSNSENYYSVWTRDAIVSALGVLHSGDADLVETAENSWRLLHTYQTDKGRIPAYVSLEDPDMPQPEFGGWGRIETLDSQMWYVVGAQQLFFHTQNDWYVSPKLLACYEQALDLLEYRASESSHLVDWPISAGWDDQMQRRHHVLSLECLRILAYEAISDLFAAAGDQDKVAFYQKKVGDVRETVRDTFWLDQDKASWLFSHATLLNGPGYYSASMENIIEYLQEMPVNFFTSYLAPYEITPSHLRFDTYANVLAILSGVADQEQSDKILSYITDNALHKPWPVRVLDPVIKPGDKDYHDFYEYGRNKPYQYQNGAVWPHISGLYILACLKEGRGEDAVQALDGLVAMVKQPGHHQDEWGFNEYYHGETGLPGSDAHDNQAWSAGGLLYAVAALVDGKKIL